MSYLTIDDLTSLVPMSVMQDLSDDNTCDEINIALVQSLIDEACEEVDGYLRGRYSLPFNQTPTLVRQCAKQIARYMLYERRPEGFDLPPAVIDGRKNAIKSLEKIRDGLISLGIPADALNAGKIINDDGEFHVRVRPAKDNQATFSNELLDRY